VILLWFLLISAAFTVKAGSGDLWKTVNGECVPNQQVHSDPAPCSEVNVSKGVDSGFAVLKDGDPSKPHAYLLIPTLRIMGIESAAVLARGSPNYFDDAWASRSYLVNLLKAPIAWDMVGLAVNSAKDRTQDQLHIHIDCVRSDIRCTLRSKENVFDNLWSELKLPAPDHPYMTTKLATDSLEGSNPFRLLADGIAGAKDLMGLETLVVVGAVFKDGKRGFYLLSSRHGASVSARGEDLLDPDCQLAGVTK